MSFRSQTQLSRPDLWFGLLWFGPRFLWVPLDPSTGHSPLTSGTWESMNHGLKKVGAPI